MNKEIKEILEIFKQVDLEQDVGGCYNCPKKDKDKTCIGCLNNAKDKLLDYITNLEQENEKLKEQNNDLRKIYKNTCNRLFENGNDELARYFQAQIDECPTFYVEPIIDYAKEWKDYKSRIDKAIEYIKDEYYRRDDNKFLGEVEIDGLLAILEGKDE